LIKKLASRRLKKGDCPYRLKKRGGLKSRKKKKRSYEILVPDRPPSERTKEEMRIGLRPGRGKNWSACVEVVLKFRTEPPKSGRTTEKKQEGGRRTLGVGAPQGCRLPKKKKSQTPLKIVQPKKPNKRDN